MKAEQDQANTSTDDAGQTTGKNQTFIEIWAGSGLTLLNYSLLWPSLIYQNYKILQLTDQPANDAANSEAKSNGVQEKPTEEEKEKEEITFTLDEWKAQQGEKAGPKFNTRKAGEGSDLDPKWKKTYAYKKEKETNEEDEEEVKNASLSISISNG